MNPINRIATTIIIIMAFAFNLMAEEPDKPGYILLRDSIYHQGRIYYNPAAPVGVKFRFHGQKPEEGITYRADEVLEFQVFSNDSTLYVSQWATYKGTRSIIFMETLTQGTNRLYKATGTNHRFYINNGALIPLTRSNYREVIKSLPGICDTLLQNQTLIRFNKQSMAFYVNSANNGTCFRPPYASLSIVAGVQYSQTVLPQGFIFRRMPMIQTGNMIDYREIIGEIVPYVGLQYSRPSLKNPLMHFTINASYIPNTISRTYTNGIQLRTIEFNRHFLSTSVGFSYEFSAGKVVPYVGGAISVLSNLNQNFLTVTDTPVESGSNSLATDFTDDMIEFVPNNYFGLDITAGVRYYLSPKRHISIVARAQPYIFSTGIRSQGTTGDGKLVHFRQYAYSLGIAVNLWPM